MVKRNVLAAGISVVVLCIILALAASPTLFFRMATHADSPRVVAATTINGLTRIAVVGSTQFIVDAHGRTVTVDANPYGVAIAPTTMAISRNPNTLKAGDIVVTNIGANDTGVTLVRFPAKMGPGRLFNVVPNGGTKGPSGEAFNTLTGTDWVANTSGNNVQIFRQDGSVFATLTSPLFNKPWGQAFNAGTRNPVDGAVDAFFSSNVADATIDRIDVVSVKGRLMFRIFQIGQLARTGGETKIGMQWVPILRFKGKVYRDVLLAVDPAMNRIAAFPNSSTVHTANGRPMDKGITLFQGRPLNMPIGLAVNPLNGDLLVVNANDNNLVELNLATARVVGVRLLDNVPVDQKTGNGSALIGVAAAIDARRNLQVFFTDDNTNTLDVLSV